MIRAARIARAIAFIVLVLSWLEQTIRIMQLEEENENLRNWP